MIDNWLSISDWISNLILAGIAISGTVLIFRIKGIREIKVHGITINIKQFWMVVFLYTIVHAFVAWSFIDATQKIVTTYPQSELKLDAWNKLTTGQNIVFNGMRERVYFSSFNFVGLEIPFYSMSWDPATILSLVFICVLFTSLLVPIRPGIIGWLDAFFLAFVLSMSNWFIGTKWAVTASMLCS